MVHGEKCPICGSKNVSDDSIHYTYENPSRTSAGWNCDDCNCSYQVLYKAEEIHIVPWDEEFDDADYDREYTVKI